MPPAGTLQAKGIDRAMQVLAALAKEMGENNIAGRDLLDAGKAALELANAGTPVRTGRLASNNKMEATKTGLRFYNETPYAAQVHFGTSRMPPRPFFSPALAFLEERFAQLFAQDMVAFVKDAIISG